MSKLGTRLTVVVLGSVVVTSAVTGAFSICGALSVFRSQVEHDGNSLAQVIAAMSVEEIIGRAGPPDEGGAEVESAAAGSGKDETVPDLDYLRTHIGQVVEGNPSVLAVRIYDEFGELAFAYPDEVPAAGSTTRRFEAPIEVQLSDVERDSVGRVELYFDNSRLAQLFWQGLSTVSLGGVGSFVVLALTLLYFLRRNVLCPVADLDGQVTRISAGDLSQPIRLDRRDELGRFARALETMRTNLSASYSRIEKQVEDLRDLDRMKDEFLANTSHELKTPLNGIIGLTESLALGSYGEVQSDQREALDMLSSCAHRLWKMTESILTFSRLQAQVTAGESERKTQCLAEHIDLSIVDLRATSEKAGIPIRFGFPSDLELTYPESEVEQVVRILLDNALKFTPCGHIEILAKKWQHGRHAGCQIAVRDTGPGIPADKLDTVFEPFTQGFHHETRKHGGVGLGLSIASKLASRIDGKILVDCPAGGGTTFTLLVPDGQYAGDVATLFEPWPPSAPVEGSTGALDRAASAPPARGSARAAEAGVSPAPATALRAAAATRPRRDAANPVPPPARSPASVSATRPLRILAVAEAAQVTIAPAASPDPRHRILVVDDEEVNCEVVRQALKDHFDVSCAYDGKSGLDTIRETTVDLVLLDIMMPGMSGYDVLEAMRAAGLLDAVPVIVLSAKSSPSAVVKGLELGASDYLAKPFHREELLCRIGNLLRIRDQQEQLRREVEARTTALEVAQEALRIKSELLANVSHELRTPLNGILGFAQLAAESRSESDGDLREALDAIYESASNLLDVVSSLLDLSRLERAGLERKTTRCDPARVVEETAAPWKERAADKSLELVVTASDAAGDVWMDAEAARRALDPLLSNAVKFSRSGRIEVSASLSGDVNESAAPVLEIRVADQGIGIEGQPVECLFQPFRQGDGSSTREFGGVGLGLSLSHTIARSLNGDVSLRSNESGGTTATLRLPVSFEPPQVVAAARSTPAARSEAQPVA